MSERPYSRVYHSIVDDPKFANVFDDDRLLATWLRLLIVAEQAYPASAYIPQGTNRHAVRMLGEAGLLDLGTGSRFRVHGLASEREMRAQSARNAAAVRWHSNGIQASDATAMLDETRRDKTSNTRAKARNTVDADPLYREQREAYKTKYGDGS